jgi:hypothetical protein
MKSLSVGQMLRVYLPEGGPCISNKSKNYSIMYDVVCDNTEPFLKIDSSAYDKFDPNKCTNVIELRSKYGN